MGVGDGAGDLVFAVDVVDAILVDDVEGAVVDGIGGEAAVGVDDVEPLGEEEVDLVDVLLEGGVAGGVPLDVVGGAQAFAGVQGDVGGADVGFTMRRMAQLLVRPGRRRRAAGERAIVVRGRGEQQLLHRLDAKQADDKDDEHDGAKKGKHIQDAAETLPTFFLRIVKDLFGHACLLR